MELPGKTALVGATLFAAQPIFADEANDPTDGLWQNQSCRSMAISPAIAKKRIHAHTTVVYDITADGRVENIRVKESDPSGILNGRAKRAIKYWRYYAYIKDGVEAPRKDVVATFTYGGNADENSTRCLHSHWPDTSSSVGDPADPLNYLMHCRTPLVPMQMARKRVAAKIDLTYNVSSEGKVQDVNIATDAAEPHFGTNAVKALKRWRYHSFVLKGTPVERNGLTISLYFGEKPENAALHQCQFASWEDANSYEIKRSYRMNDHER